MDKPMFVQQKMEIIAALLKLSEDLTVDEKSFFDNNSDSSMKQFMNVNDNIVLSRSLLKK